MEAAHPKVFPSLVQGFLMGGAVFLPGTDSNSSIDKIVVFGGQVPGRQTVPRAELWAAINMLKLANEALDLSIGIDASYVTKGIDNIDRLAKGENGDLWSILAQLQSKRSGTLTLFKLKSHLDEEGPKALSEGRISFHNLLGNALSDEAASHTNKVVQTDFNVQRSARKAEILSYSVAKRIALIQADIWKHNETNEEKYELDPVPKRASFKQASANACAFMQALKSGHRLYPHQKGFKCDHCKVYRAKNNFDYWLRNKCAPKLPASLLVAKRRKQGAEILSASANSKADPVEEKPNRKAQDSQPLGMFDDPDFEMPFNDDEEWTHQPYASEGELTAEADPDWEQWLPEATTGASSTTTYDTTGGNQSVSEEWETSVSNALVVCTMPPFEASASSFKGKRLKTTTHRPDTP